MGAQDLSGAPDLSESSSAERLDSWKEIAAHLRRGVTTVQRWEHQEGLPVRRHPHDKRGSVYAFKSELDAWWEDGHRRLHSEDSESGGQASSAQVPLTVGRPIERPVWARPLTWILVLSTVVAIGGGAVWSTIRSRRAAVASEGSVVQLALNETLRPGPGSAVAVSPDRASLVYLGARDGVDQLFLRSVDTLDTVAVRHTEQARSPFFSPDGRWIGFFAEGELRKVSLDGGPAVTICAAPGIAAGASWGPDDRIVFGRLGFGLVRVAADGGALEPITEPDRDQAEIDHRWPEMVPGGRGVIFTIWTGSLETARVAVQSLETGRRWMLSPGSYPRAAGTDHVVFARPDGLWAVRFSAERPNLVGSPVHVLDAVQLRHGGAADYDLADDGSLVYVPGPTERHNTLVWVDLEGRRTPISRDRRLYSSPRISPDGSHIAVTIQSREGAFDIWVYDLARDQWRRLPTVATSLDPIWTPDGKRITFASNALGARQPVLDRCRRQRGSRAALQERVGHVSAFMVASQPARLPATELVHRP